MANLRDYVCWGDHTEGRKDTIEPHAEGNDFWSGDCVAAPGDGSIRRKSGTSGEDMDSYDTEASGSVDTCPAP